MLDWYTAYFVFKLSLVKFFFSFLLVYLSRCLIYPCGEQKMYIIII